MDEILFDFTKWSKRKLVVFHMWKCSNRVSESLKMLEIPFDVIECEDENALEKFNDNKKEYCGIIITGGIIEQGFPAPSLPEVILKAKMPKLGICLGNEMLGCYLGAEMTECNLGETMGEPIGEVIEVTAELFDDILFEGLALPGNYLVRMEHYYMLDRLPSGAKLIASTNFTPVAGFHHESKDIWGLQFHPEKDWIKDIVFRNYYKICINK
jgi:GMP synthase-like glutamine amidotransferase